MTHNLSRFVIYAAGFVAAACLVSCSAEGSPGASAPENSEEDSTPIAGFKLEPRDLSRHVRVSGTVEPVERIRIKSHISGVLSELGVEEGDSVRAGQRLASSDLGEMHAERRLAEAELAKLERQRERKKPLVETQAVRRAELDDLKAEIDVAQSQIELWDTRIELAEVKAPKDAVVATRHVDPGGYVASGEPIVDLVDVSTLVVPVTMSERDVVAIDADDPVEITVDAHDDERLQASIRRIFPTADAHSRRVAVELAIDEIPEQMVIKPGFRVRAIVEADARHDVLAIPDESLLASSPEERFVYAVDDDDKLVRRDITIGVQRRGMTEVVEGLEEGEIVVGIHPGDLSEGTLVHVTQWVGEND